MNKVKTDLFKQPSCSLALVFYNEQENVVPVVESLHQALTESDLDCQLVLVDNGSEDDTPTLISDLASASSRVKTVTVPKNLGYGWGVINGLKACDGQWVGYMDGDAQISPEDVVRFLRQVAPGKEIIKVRRRRRMDGFIRMAVSEIYIILFSLLFGTRIYDINAKPVMFKKELLPCLELRSRDWFIDAEFTIKASRLGCNFCEVPVVFLRRQAGRSSVRPGTVWEFLKNMFRYRLGKELDRWEKNNKSRS